MYDDCACEYKLNNTGTLCLWIRLSVLFRHTYVVPVVQIAPLHVDNVAKLS